MKTLCLLLLAGLLATPLHAQKPQAQVVAVAFYNFENLFDTLDDPKRFDEDFTPAGPYRYTQKIYNQKLHNLATVLVQLGTEYTPDGPALIGTAEIENERVLQDLAQQPELKSREYQYVWFDSPDPRGIDAALLYHPKYFRPLAARALKVDLKGVPGSDSKSGATRDILWSTGVLAGDTVQVFVAHWPSRRGGEAASAPLRAKAAGVARRIIDSLTARNGDTRVILMGDLNDDPVSPSVAQVLGAVGNKEKVPAGGLYNPFWAFYKRGIGSLGYNDSWNLFDQIILSRNWLKEYSATGWQFYKAEVFNRDFLCQRFGRYKGYPHRSFEGTTWVNGYSDHFPTLVYLVREVK